MGVLHRRCVRCELVEAVSFPAAFDEPRSGHYRQVLRSLADVGKKFVGLLISQGSGIVGAWVSALPCQVLLSPLPGAANLTKSPNFPITADSSSLVKLSN